MTATIWLLIILILLVMGDIIFVKPGHYRRKGERPDGHEDMIRVLGPDPKNESKWITNRGSMSDSEIKDKYEPFDTTTSEQPVQRSRPVIGDLNAPPSRRQSKPPQQTTQQQTPPQLQTTQPQTPAIHSNPTRYSRATNPDKVHHKSAPNNSHNPPHNYPRPSQVDIIDINVRIRRGLPRGSHSQFNSTT